MIKRVLVLVLVLFCVGTVYLISRYSKPTKDSRHGSLDENLDTRTDKITVEHPFFNDFAEAFQAVAVKKLGPKDREQLKQIYCSLLPSSYLKIRWPGWEIGIPRPKESVPNEVFELRQRDIALFLSDFFKRVENGKLYCDYSAVVEQFGEEQVEGRMAGKTGLHYNLERVYWTLNVKLNDWIKQNIKTYDCSLVCELDEIVAKSDSYLREAFFPTPGPFDIGPKKRKELQKQMLHQFAPALEKPLIEQIWR